jgi:hypothetical protein
LTERLDMSDKKCPNCGVWNAEAAILCDCGYDFSTETKPPPDDGPGSPRWKRARSSLLLSSIGLGISSMATLPYLILGGHHLIPHTLPNEGTRSVIFAALFLGLFSGFIFGLTGIVLGIVAWARTPRSLKIFLLSFGCLLLSVEGIIGNLWFYATCQFCQ